MLESLGGAWDSSEELIMSVIDMQLTEAVMSMSIDQAFAKLRECLSGARYTEGLEAMEVLRSHIEREVVVTDEMERVASEVALKSATIHKVAKTDGSSAISIHLDMKAALIAALEMGK